MKNVIRKIDKAGRIVLPIDFRKNIGINEGEEVLLSINENDIIIKKNSSACRICNRELTCKNQFLICHNCIDKIKKHLKSKP